MMTLPLFATTSHSRTNNRAAEQSHAVTTTVTHDVFTISLEGTVIGKRSATYGSVVVVCEGLQVSLNTTQTMVTILKEDDNSRSQEHEQSLGAKRQGQICQLRCRQLMCKEQKHLPITSVSESVPIWRFRLGSLSMHDAGEGNGRDGSLRVLL